MSAGASGWLAVLAAAAAGWWSVGASSAASFASSREGLGRGTAGPVARAVRGRGAILLTASTGTAVVALVPAEHLALAAVVVTAGAGAAALAARGRAEAAALARRERVVGAAEAFLGGLRAGQPPSRALERAAQRWPELAPVAATARLGGEVGQAFREAGRRRGAEGLARLAAAWELSVTSGAGLAQAVEQVLETARAEQVALRRVRAEIASARATARVVAVLPVVVLVAADGMGAHPWSFLLDTTPGVLCLGFGLMLGLGGLAWVDGIARQAVAGT